MYAESASMLLSTAKIIEVTAKQTYQCFEIEHTFSFLNHRISAVNRQDSVMMPPHMTSGFPNKGKHAI